jgi:hypothetical protein
MREKKVHISDKKRLSFRVANQHHFNADPDPTFPFRADPVESLLIFLFFLAPRDQPVQRDKPATHRPAGYPQAAGYPPTSRLRLYIIL